MATMTARMTPAGAPAPGSVPPAGEDDSWEEEFRKDIRENARQRREEMTRQAEEEFSRAQQKSPDPSTTHAHRQKFDHAIAQIERLLRDEENQLLEKERSIRNWSQAGSMSPEMSEAMIREQKMLWAAATHSKLASSNEARNSHDGMAQSTSPISSSPIARPQHRPSGQASPNPERWIPPPGAPPHDIMNRGRQRSVTGSIPSNSPDETYRRRVNSSQSHYPPQTSPSYTPFFTDGRRMNEEPESMTETETEIDTESEEEGDDDEDEEVVEKSFGGFVPPPSTSIPVEPRRRGSSPISIPLATAHHTLWRPSVENLNHSTQSRRGMGRTSMETMGPTHSSRPFGNADMRPVRPTDHFASREGHPPRRGSFSGSPVTPDRVQSNAEREAAEIKRAEDPWHNINASRGRGSFGVPPRPHSPPTTDEMHPRSSESTPFAWERPKHDPESDRSSISPPQKILDHPPKIWRPASNAPAADKPRESNLSNLSRSMTNAGIHRVETSRESPTVMDRHPRSESSRDSPSMADRHQRSESYSPYTPHNAKHPPGPPEPPNVLPYRPDGPSPYTYQSAKYSTVPPDPPNGFSYRPDMHQSYTPQNVNHPPFQSDPSVVFPTPSPYPSPVSPTGEASRAFRQSPLADPTDEQHRPLPSRDFQPTYDSRAGLSSQASQPSTPQIRHPTPEVTPPRPSFSTSEHRNGYEATKPPLFTIERQRSPYAQSPSHTDSTPDNPVPPTAPPVASAPEPEDEEEKFRLQQETLQRREEEVRRREEALVKKAEARKRQEELDRQAEMIKKREETVAKLEAEEREREQERIRQQQLQEEEKAREQERLRQEQRQQQEEERQRELERLRQQEEERWRQDKMEAAARKEAEKRQRDDEAAREEAKRAQDILNKQREEMEIQQQALLWKRHEERKKQVEEERKQEELKKREEEIRRRRQDSMPTASNIPRQPSATGSFSSGPIPGRSGPTTSSASSTASWSSRSSASSAASDSTRASTSSASSSWSMPSAFPSASARSTPSTSSSSRTATGDSPKPSGWRTTSTSSRAGSMNSGSSSSYTSGSPGTDGEWQRRQEEQARKQQEQFRQETQRLEREKQAKAAQSTSKDQVIKAWANYELAWSSMKDQSALRFRTMPWPVLNCPTNTEELTTNVIGTFVLSPHHSQEKTPRDRIKEQLLRWHPDRFEGKWLSKVIVEEKEAVRRGVGQVVRGLNELLSRESSPFA